MHLDRASLWVAAISVAAASCPGLGHGASADQSAWFRTHTQALFDAITAGNRAIWAQTLDEDCIITSEDGDVQSRSQFLEAVQPLPRGFEGHGTIRELTVRDLGDAAVVHYLIDEREDIFGQQLATKYYETDTYHRHEGSWKIVALQITVVPRDLEPLSHDSSDWTAMRGDYRFPGAAAIRYRVFEKDGALYGGRDEKSATRLIPLAPLTFFQAGSIHMMIFVKDSAGRITEVREIHKYNEVRMEHVAASASVRRSSGALARNVR